MYTFVLIIHIIASFILVAVILLQAGKGGGLAQTFGGGSATTIFGQKASTFLTRATTVSAVLFLCTSLSLALISGRRSKSLMERIKIPSATETEETAAPAETVRKVEIDPETGEEKVVEEKTVPVTEEEK